MPTRQLTEALALIDHAQRWLSEQDSCVARTAAGARCGPTDPDAARWSWRGAIYATTASLAQREAVFLALEQARPGFTLAMRGRAPLQHAEVVKVFGRAIAATAATGGHDAPVPAGRAGRTPSPPNAS
jgi:hypothetical protein